MEDCYSNKLLYLYNILTLSVFKYLPNLDVFSKNLLYFENLFNLSRFLPIIVLIGYPNNLCNLLILDAQKYLGYPPKNSSPPSPERATVTYFLANLHKKYVGILLLSANGSSCNEIISRNIFLYIIG